MMKLPSEALQAALDRISDPLRWTKGADRKRITCRGKRFYCYCARGAVQAAADWSLQQRCMEILVAAVPPAYVAKHNCGTRPSVINYNDHPTTKHRMVVAWFKRAIVYAKRIERHNREMY